MTPFLLDTNICIYIIKQSPQCVFDKLKTIPIGDIGISAVTFCELQFGVSNSTHKTRNQDALNEFLAPIEIIDFPNDAAPLYGEIRTYLKQKGQTIGPLDLLIGIHALFMNAVLVTNNVREFSNIPKLKVENWVL